METEDTTLTRPLKIRLIAQNTKNPTTYDIVETSFEDYNAASAAFIATYEDKLSSEEGFEITVAVVVSE